MKRRGIGYSCMFYGTGYGNGWPDESTARVEIHPNGKIYLYTEATEVGQGTINVMLQIASEALEIDMDNINLRSTNTAYNKDAGTAAASRQTYNTGNAVKIACDRLKRNMQLALRAASKTDINIKNYSLKDIYHIMINHNKETVEEGYFKANTSVLDVDSGQGDPYWPYVYAAWRAVVDVNDETGKVDVIEMDACNDVGKAINPMQVEGQIQGGVVMGIGYALMEEVIFKDGDIRNKNFSDYIIPTSKDIPEMKTIIVEDYEETGPYGAKGVGEPSTIPAATAILNAIYDAVGIRLTSLPATQDKIIKAIKEKNDLGS